MKLVRTSHKSPANPPKWCLK